MKNVFIWDGEKYNSLPNGDYAQGEIIPITGGAVNVDNGEEEIVEATWIAGGGDNHSVQLAGNWNVAAELLNFSNGKLRATFAATGTVADIDAAVKFLGVRITNTEGFTFAKAAEAAAIEILDEGVAVTGEGDFEIAAPVSAPVSQRWSVGSNATLRLTGGLASAEGARFSSEGKGAIEFGGAGAISGRAEISNDTVIVSGNLETPGHVDQGNPRPWSYSSGFYVNPLAFRIIADRPGAKVFFDNARVEKPLWLDGNKDATPSWFNLTAGSTNVFAGQVFFGSPIGELNIPADAAMIFENGVSFGGEVTVRAGLLRVTGGNFSAGTGSGMFVRDSARIEYATAGNSGKFRLYGGTIEALENCAISNAYASFLSGSPTIIMNGHDLHFNYINHDWGTPAFQSDGPAQLTVGYDKNYYHNSNYGGTLSGGISIVKNGDGGSLTLTAAFDSAGDLTVNGTTNVLTMASTASWHNGTNVTVAATSTLRLLGTNQFNGRAAVLRISDSGVVELADGTRQRFLEMYVNGEKAPSGIYGSAEAAGVDYRYAEHFSGTGTVMVGAPGLMLSIR